MTLEKIFVVDKSILSVLRGGFGVRWVCGLLIFFFIRGFVIGN